MNDEHTRCMTGQYTKDLLVIHIYELYEICTDSNLDRARSSPITSAATKHAPATSPTGPSSVASTTSVRLTTKRSGRSARFSSSSASSI